MHFRSSPKADLDFSWRPPHGGRWQFGVPEFLVGCKVFAPKSKHRVRQKITQRAAKGETPYAIAKALGIDRHTVMKYAG